MDRRTAGLWLLLLLGAQARAQVATVAQDVAQLRLGSKAFTVEGRTVAFGGLQLAFKHGTVTPVLAGERQVGLFFAGEGELTYTVADPLLEPVFAYNVKNATSLELASRNAVTAACETALVLTSSPPEELLSPWPQGEQAPP